MTSLIYIFIYVVRTHRRKKIMNFSFTVFSLCRGQGEGERAGTHAGRHAGRQACRHAGRQAGRQAVLTVFTAFTILTVFTVFTLRRGQEEEGEGRKTAQHPDAAEVTRAGAAPVRQIVFKSSSQHCPCHFLTTIGNRMRKKRYFVWLRKVMNYTV